MKIIDYKVVSQSAVPDLLKAGWQPYGLPIIFWAHGGFTKIVQAMVRYEQPPSPPALRSDRRIGAMDRRSAAELLAARKDVGYIMAEKYKLEAENKHLRNQVKRNIMLNAEPENKRLREALEWAMGNAHLSWDWIDELRRRAGLEEPKP